MQIDTASDDDTTIIGNRYTFISIEDRVSTVQTVADVTLIA